ncbi:MAG: hypothetical protein N2Z23_10480 [Pyrinomonadaceae bacterium]|nr:hypothetical protein [Pyrinomonadaceae bacterium]
MIKVFCKTINCPSSEALLDFQKNRLAIKEARKVSEHLLECEFCASEVAFYSRLKRIKEPSNKIAPIPPKLLELAGRLLRKGNKTSNGFKDSV